MKYWRADGFSRLVKGGFMTWSSSRGTAMHIASMRSSQVHLASGMMLLFVKCRPKASSSACHVPLSLSYVHWGYCSNSQFLAWACNLGYHCISNKLWAVIAFISWVWALAQHPWTHPTQRAWIHSNKGQPCNTEFPPRDPLLDPSKFHPPTWNFYRPWVWWWHWPQAY